MARWGGDEFAILLPPREEARDLPRSQNASSRKSTAHSRSTVMRSSSASASASRASTMTVLRSRNAAQQRRSCAIRGQGEGRNRWRSYERQLGLHAQHRRTLEIDLRAAVANETIEVHYQPINNAATREMVGCGAVRWRHPTRGYVSPGGVHSNRRRAWLDGRARTDRPPRRTCAACTSWPEDGISSAVALSPLQVRGGRMANTIKEAIEMSGLAPHH